LYRRLKVCEGREIVRRAAMMRAKFDALEELESAKYSLEAVV
jgi:hypothetical protein